MPYKSRAQKETERLAHAHRYANMWAKYAEAARESGNTQRAMWYYEFALNDEIDALNQCLRDEPCDNETIGQLYANVIFYAQSCGRYRKAEHLRAAALRWEKLRGAEAETAPDQSLAALGASTQNGSGT